MRRILLVGDDTNQQKLLTWELEDEGHAVATAHCERDALRVLRSWRPDVVVLDSSLEVFHGGQFLDRIRMASSFNPRRSLAPRVILYSGNATLREHVAAGSVDDFVLKSSDLSRLKHAVSGARSRRRHRATA